MVKSEQNDDDADRMLRAIAEGAAKVLQNACDLYHEATASMTYQAEWAMLAVRRLRVTRPWAIIGDDAGVAGALLPSVI